MRTQELLSRIFFIFALMVLLFSIYGSVDAQNSVKDVPQTKVFASSDNDFLSDYYDNLSHETEQEKPLYVVVFSFILKLSIVVLMIVGVVYGLKRFSQLQSKITKNNKIQVLDTVSISAGRNLHIVKVGTKHMLLGSCASEISFLKDLDRDDLEQEKQEHFINQPINNTANDVNKPIGFKTALSNYINNIPDNATSAQKVAGMIRETSSFLHEQIKDLGTSRKNFQ